MLRHRPVLCVWRNSFRRSALCGRCEPVVVRSAIETQEARDRRAVAGRDLVFTPVKPVRFCGPSARPTISLQGSEGATGFAPAGP